MRKNLTLTAEEVRACIAAVDTILHCDNESWKHTEFDYKTRHKLLTSCLKKLNAYSPLTYFTKQEYTMMRDALDYLIEVNSLFGDHDPEFYTAADKTADLAGLE